MSETPYKPPESVLDDEAFDEKLGRYKDGKVMRSMKLSFLFILYAAFIIPGAFILFSAVFSLIGLTNNEVSQILGLAIFFGGIWLTSFLIFFEKLPLTKR